MEKINLLNKRIEQARGVIPADLVLKNCQVINVFSGEIVNGDIAICGKYIAGVGNYNGEKEIDCQGKYVAPGFMEAHIHIESSMLSPEQFVRAVLPHGTTTVVCDPHEIANVAGREGINYFLAVSKDQPCSIFCMAPSCVPATHLENSGARLDADALEEILDYPGVIGVAEMMNYPGVLFQDDVVLQKLHIAARKDMIVDGHAPGLIGKDLQAYIGSGIRSDHECTTAAEAMEKLRSGMHLFIREGSTAKNLKALLPAVTEGNQHRCMLVTDDCHPQDLLDAGHLDRILRKAIGLGLDPVTAIQMVTINVANYYGFRDRGAVSPGYLADLVFFDDILDIQPDTVFSKGKNWSDTTKIDSIEKNYEPKDFPKIFDSVHVDLKNLSFTIPAEKENIRVIKVIPEQLITESLVLPASILHGFAVADTKRDLAKLAVVERHKKTGNTGLGFVQGTGLKRGALSSTVGHDSHNITVLGMDDGDMELAVQTIVNERGGLVVVNDRKVLEVVPLNVAGLMSAATVEEVAERFLKILTATRIIGIDVNDPFMFMSFLSLPVIPHLKMTDLGLVDVDTFSHVSLWV